MSVFPATTIPPPNQQNDYERQTDNLCQLFQDTLQSLGPDTAAIRRLTKAKAKEHAVEDLYPLFSKTLSSMEADTAVFRRFQVGNNENQPPSSNFKDLDPMVTEMEQQVVALRQRIQNKQRAVDRFEHSLQSQVNQQAQQILAFRIRSSNEQQRAMPVDEQGTPIPEQPCPQTSSLSRRWKFRRDSVDPQNETNIRTIDNKTAEGIISLDRVTLPEFQAIPRTIRGRITRLDLKEALEEIEQIVSRKKQATTLPPPKDSITNSLQRRYEYLQQRQNGNAIVEVKGHEGQSWVSEQELRQNCAFFRHGENKARATLQLLCSLKRLKQVPGRNMEITYIICLITQNQE